MRRSAGQKAGRRLDQPMEKSRGRGHTDHADALCRALFAGMPAVGWGRHQDFVAPRETSSQLPKDDRDRTALDARGVDRVARWAQEGDTHTGLTVAPTVRAEGRLERGQPIGNGIPAEPPANARTTGDHG